jgi:hypothetical protein
MADLALTSNWTAPATIRRPHWLDALAHRHEVLRRRSRRDRYLALTGRLAKGYPWFGGMVQSMSGR